MASTKMGVVVVGVGIAGGVRIRDILLQSEKKEFKEMEHIKLIGHVSRREMPKEGSTQLTLEDALQRSDVHCVLICTENERHEHIARLAIEAGKHVLVEFPLAVTAIKAKELTTLAKEKGVTCYEEDIALLTERHEHMKKVIKDKPKLVEGKVWLSGGFNRWIEDLEKSGSAFHSSINHIHELLELFGEITPVEAKIVKSNNKIATVGTVKTPDGGLIEFEIKREVLDKPKRDTGFCYKFSDGTEIDSKTLDVPLHSSGNKPGLFLRDFIQFVCVVRGEIDGTEQEKRALRGLEVADELYQLAKNHPESVL